MPVPVAAVITPLPFGAWLIAGALLVDAFGLGVVVWRADALKHGFTLKRFQE